MDENRKKCPICPRSCDLSSPHCTRGEEYARTGKVLQHQEHGNGSGHGQEHGPRLQFKKQEEQLVMKYLHHAVGAADRGGIRQEQAEEMFSVLTPEETKTLAGLLEKLSDHWMELAPNGLKSGHRH